MSQNVYIVALTECAINDHENRYSYFDNFSGMLRYVR